LPLASIDKDDYAGFCDFLESACGIVLGDNKQYLVQSRLGRLMADTGAVSLGDLVARLRRETDGGPLRERVIEAMTTNETLWFRDRYPFDILGRQVLPRLASEGRSPVRIWSAACSSGQEPYSISMTVEDFLAAQPGALRDVRILATDVSPAVLADARAASYEADALSRGLPEDYRRRYFEPDPAAGSGRWRLREPVRRRVRFSQFNLLDSYAPLGQFDVIFCRNVLIYFSTLLKTDILSRMAAILAPGGYLFLGASESVSRYSDAFETERCCTGSVFRRK